MKTFSDVIDRQPELSYFAPNNFFLVFDKLPQVQFNCQQIQIPSITIGETDVPNRMNPTGMFIPGDRLDYGVLDITFLVEKDFRNYRSVLKWMKAATSPDDFKQFNEWDGGEFGDLFSDCTVFGTDASNSPVVQWNFKNCFPISLDGVQFDTTITEPDYFMSTTSIRFTYFTTNTYTNGIMDNNEV